ncbi:MAG TPA: M48 family metalloprotease [Vicinamibacterales bacterium]|nr:M48 family metalloprotease [Vicinamibacterales bacterium]
MIRTLLLIGLLSCASVLATAQAAGPTFPNPGKTSMSKDNQHALGMETAAQVFQQMPVLPDYSEESQYIRQLGKKLVATIPEEYSWPFEFHVIPDKQINAFALPGGQMFINIGTLTSARNEAELAGVMGHEMAHVYMQHSAKQAGKGQTTSMIAGIASAVLGGTVGKKAGGLVGQLGQMGIQMGAQGLLMKYSRSDETQADAVGAIILHKAGYNPQSMVDFFKTMGAKAGAAPPELFSSHPNPGNRQENIKKQIANWPATDYVGESASFDEAHKRALQVKTYTPQEIQAGAKSGQWAALNKRNGAGLYSPGENTFPTRASGPPSAVSLETVQPSQKMKTTDLGPLKISHPDNWPVTLPEQKGQFVTIAHQAGVTNRGVGYGVLLNGAAGPEGQKVSIDDMTVQLIKQIQQSNELEQLGNPQPLTVGGLEGRSTFLRSPSPFPDSKGQTMPERDWLVTVPTRGGSLIFMIFVAPEADFDKLEPIYQAMVKSVQFR